MVFVHLQTLVNVGEGVPMLLVHEMLLPIVLPLPAPKRRHWGAPVVLVRVIVAESTLGNLPVLRPAPLPIIFHSVALATGVVASILLVRSSILGLLPHPYPRATPGLATLACLLRFPIVKPCEVRVGHAVALGADLGDILWEVVDEGLSEFVHLQPLLQVKTMSQVTQLFHSRPLVDERPSDDVVHMGSVKILPSADGAVVCHRLVVSLIFRIHIFQAICWVLSR